MSWPTPPDAEYLEPVTGYLESNGHTSVAIYPLTAGLLDPLRWARLHRDRIRRALRGHGIVLLRGIPVDVELFAQIVAAIGGDALSYEERSTPRSRVADKIYTSTEYPADQRIPLHNENSYADRWPSTLFFLCETPAEHGGATPVADSRSVLRRIAQETQDRFVDGIRYTRTYRELLGLSWQEAFQTESRDEVAEYCLRHGQDFHWDGPVLRTTATRPAWREDPRSGARVWFNQAHLFHLSALDAEVRAALLEIYADGDLPRNAYHADGRPLRAEDIADIERAYRDCALSIPWQRGDLLIVDNMLAAHGREPYRGPRRILVAMT